MSALEGQGVLFGVVESGIERLVSGRLYNEKLVLARGREAIHGRGTRVHYLFNTDIGRPYLLMEYDRINLKELDYMQNRVSGDVLAELKPGVKPQDGMNVLGETLAAGSVPEDEALKAGEKTRFSPDRDKIIALIDGNAYVKAGAVHMEPVVTVENVNYQTGNLDFIGSIVINGTIVDGFTVNARGSVQVGKCVGRSSITAGNGILLKGGINGSDEGFLACDGDILAKFIENAHVRCNGNLIVEEAVMHARISIKRNVLFTGRRAELLAGQSIIGQSLWCKKLGNLSEINTKVSVGVNPETIEMYQKVHKAIGIKQEELDQLDMKMKSFDIKIKARTDDEEKQAGARDRLVGRIGRLGEEIDYLLEKARQIRQTMTARAETMVVAEEMIFSGVTITFGREEYPVPLRGLRKTVLSFTGDRVIETGFSPHNAPELTF